MSQQQSEAKREIGRVGVVGGGLIGRSWTSLFLARGLDVVVVDPRPGLGEAVAAFVADAWPMLQALDLTISDDRRAAEFSTDIGALRDVDFVTECGPDLIDTKRHIVRELEEAIPSDVIISSSTSSLLPSEIQRDARHPERILVGHPMNPPHLIPMVELVAGRLTSTATMTAAAEFYEAMRRVVVRARKEVVGHLANRLTAALYREAVDLVAEGVGSVEDVDKAIAYGPGMRWALMGPHLTYHLGGGAGGYRHYLDHLGDTQAERWRHLGTPALTADLKTALVQGVDAEMKGQDEATIRERRDEALVELHRLKQRFGF